MFTVALTIIFKTILLSKISFTSPHFFPYLIHLCLNRCHNTWLRRNTKSCVGDKWMNSSKVNDFDKCSAIIKMSFLSFVSKRQHPTNNKNNTRFMNFYFSKNTRSSVINNFFKNVPTWVFVLLSDFYYFLFQKLKRIHRVILYEISFSNYSLSWWLTWGHLKTPFSLQSKQ